MKLRSWICAVVACLWIFGSIPAHSEEVAIPPDLIYSYPETKPDFIPPPPTSQGKNIEPIDSRGEGAGGASQMSMSPSDGGASGSQLNQLTVSNSYFTGTAVTSIPIVVPPGRNNMAPNLALTYSSQQGNGWIGVGWNIDMGAIQRATKFGVDYGSNDFVAVANGSATELVLREDWGASYYGAKIEGAFLKYYRNPSNGGWEVTAKNGTKYFYGSISDSRQDNNSQTAEFKWCLDNVVDTNGNKMTVSYEKDYYQIYLRQINYAANTGLSAPNSVIFYREPGTDNTWSYLTNFGVKTRSRLMSIKVTANGLVVRAYKLNYRTSDATGRSILDNVLLYGDDVQIDDYGNILSGTMMQVFIAGYDPGGAGFVTPSYDNAVLGASFSGSYSTWGSSSAYMRTGDFNGDGRTDYFWHPSNGDGRLVIAHGTENGLTTPIYSQPALDAMIDGYYSWNGSIAFQLLGDFNGDGNTDYMWNPVQSDGRWLIAYGTYNGLTRPDVNHPALWGTIDGTHVTWSSNGGYQFPGDFNGDGKSDYLWMPANGDGRWLIAYGTDYGVTTPNYNDNVLPAYLPGDWASWGPTPDFMKLGDFNGDGRTDYMWMPTNGDGRWLIAYGTNNGLTLPNYSTPALPGTLPDGQLTRSSAGHLMMTADFNGDGKTDFFWMPFYSDGRWLLAYGTGTGFTTPSYNAFALPREIPGGYLTWGSLAYAMRLGDFNGDGKTDYMWMPTNGDGRWLIATFGSNDIFTLPSYDNPALPRTLEGGYLTWGALGDVMMMGDFDGDRKTDYMWAPYYGDGRWVIAYPNPPDHLPDLLTSITNTSRGMTTLEYTPSTKYSNPLMPFPVYVVKSITTNDNNGNIATTSFTYGSGYYDIKERDFRGFRFMYQTNPDGTVADRYYLQDNVFKGLLEAQEVRDSGWQYYTVNNNSYLASYPYAGVAFPYLSLSQEKIFDGTENYKYVATSFEYDGYGNVTRKYNYGDVWLAGDERDERIEYNYDTTKWIVSQPSRSYVMDNAANIKAQSWFAYDPATGNLLTKTDWLSGGTNPVTRFTYNSYGNRITTTDPRNNTTTVSSYDSTYTYPTSVTNALNQVASKTYDYRYGTPLTETDINGNTTTYQYDFFGRPKKVINPYDDTSTEGTQSIYYENFGQGTGAQRVATHSTEQSGTGNYIWSESYFDGFGRTVKTRREGPDGKVIVTETDYDIMGRVAYSSLPYFEGLDNTLWISYTYDPMGRVTRVTNPDGTYITKSYTLGTTVSIDANGHKKEADSDAYGRLKQVREYTGTNPNFSLYSTTSYGYDVLGNLTNLTDAESHVTSVGYDSLSRKTSMTDPDMGYWMYEYDANGNLTYQTDAKGQTIFFTYDALNRITRKDYPAGTDIVYTYDETFSTNYKGRLTTVTDASGTTKFHYDKLGRTTKTIKTVSGVNYTTESSYDALGRTKSVIYPDPGHDNVAYTYDTGGNLSTVGSYATYTNYNALGQAGLVTYGNGASTTYQFYSQNNRLFSITTNSQGQGRQNLTYAYDNNGNIQSITDLIDTNRTQSFTYDELNRLTQAQSASYGTITHTFDPIGNIMYNSQVGSYTYSPTKPHAVVQAGANTYSYDLNGNMTGRLGITLTYDYENRLTKSGSGGKATTFVYDYAGNRVKKTKGSATTVYIGNLYECKSGVCTKHIFAGGNRIVSKDPTNTYYYHTDHLRSSSVITNASGATMEEIYYYPFGSTRVNSGSVNLKYKYTGQEEDAETVLYYYGARYYDPAIGRFVSADTFVQNFSDPQTLNRFAYARNNPLRYTDPSGHFIVEALIGAAIGALAGGTVAAITGNDVWKGMLYGGIAGAFTGGAVGVINNISGYTLASAAGAPVVPAVSISPYTAGAIYAAAGAAAGGTNAAISGGNVGEGMLYGGVGAAAGFGIEQLGGNLLFQVGGSGLAGGTMAELSGGKFSEGFNAAAINALVMVGVNEMMGGVDIRAEREEIKAENDLSVKLAAVKLDVPPGTEIDIPMPMPMSIGGKVGGGIISKITQSRWFRKNIFSYENMLATGGSKMVNILGKLQYIHRSQPSFHKGKAYTRPIEWNNEHWIDW